MRMTIKRALAIAVLAAAGTIALTGTATADDGGSFAPAYYQGK
ncbi:hypothetical protein ACFO4E_15360 [Nocardiopsis mangrovi]|uniref:Uncharacterized protein n=1 Tax=Nocardiopsis mangrovi TaxID=1179818 RepID=A0ABV9DWW3_9ACTN